MAKLYVVGLGPATKEFVSKDTLEILQTSEKIYLRTKQHPCADLCGPHAESFDDVYETAEKIEDVYEEIVYRLLETSRNVDCVYAVPGSPFVAETTVQLLLKKKHESVDLIIKPAMSFLELVWARLGIDPIEEGVRIVDGHRFKSVGAPHAGPLLVCQCDTKQVLSDIKLSYENNEPEYAIFIKDLGTQSEQIENVKWCEIDKSVTPSFLTSLYIPKVPAPVNIALGELANIAQTLREKCPWDAEQTHGSLSRYAIEEAYELQEAIENEDDDHVQEELGDLLYQVFAHCEIEREQGMYDISDVAYNVIEKLVSRHPHVFGEQSGEDMTASDVRRAWELNKAKEKSRKSISEGLPKSLPAVSIAHKIISRAKELGQLDQSVLDTVSHDQFILRGLLAAHLSGQINTDDDPEGELKKAAFKLANFIDLS